MDTGKSLSEALIFASTNQQYDGRLIIELQVQYMKIPSSNLGRTCCVQFLYTTCSPHVLQKEEPLTKIYLYPSFNDIPYLSKNIKSCQIQVNPGGCQASLFRRPRQVFKFYLSTGADSIIIHLLPYRLLLVWKAVTESVTQGFLLYKIQFLFCSKIFRSVLPRFVALLVK